jgi:hypothetical protein
LLNFSLLIKSLLNHLTGVLQMRFGLFFLLFSFSLFAQEKSLLIQPYCSDSSLILKKDSRWVMNDKKLSMINMTSILRNNPSSLPYMKSVRAIKTVGITIVCIGGAVLLTNLAITEKPFSPLGITGYVIMGTGLIVGLGANGKFTLAVNTYNNTLCKNKQ